MSASAAWVRTSATALSRSSTRRVVSCSTMAGAGSTVRVPSPRWAIRLAMSWAELGRRERLSPPLICTTWTPWVQPGLRPRASRSMVRPQETPSSRGGRAQPGEIVGPGLGDPGPQRLLVVGVAAGDHHGVPQPEGVPQPLLQAPHPRFGVDHLDPYDPGLPCLGQQPADLPAGEVQVLADLLLGEVLLVVHGGDLVQQCLVLGTAHTGTSDPHGVVSRWAMSRVAAVAAR
ncbi:hypothetical protein SMALA_7878 [Streptomyces malaysiensis subsp. malaysiensis]|nr:hypothetical protein SMALA_7878 [Streptomyces malaysiensis]